MAEKRRHSRGPQGATKKPRSDDNPDKLPPSNIYQEPWRALGAWFLGPRAENREEFKSLCSFVVDEYSNHRENFYPSDPCYITEEVKQSGAYKSEMEDTRNCLEVMNKRLTDSIPFFSTRYQGHMTWETTLPATLGYFLGMLWNQNNVDSSASPVTTVMELEVGQHLNLLMGFDTTVNSPWAHLTGCGSVANLEAMWSSRNLKFHAVAMKATCTASTELNAGLTYPVPVSGGLTKVNLGDCSTWQLLNLDVDVVCSLTENIKEHIATNTRKSTDEVGHLIDGELKHHSVINVGMMRFCTDNNIGVVSEPNGRDVLAPVVFSPGTSHYSWPKSATVLGLGDNNVFQISVDGNARQNLTDLRENLQDCVDNKRPVIMVVAVIGTTEESAVDPLADIYDLREEFKTKGLNFAIHADAAWGGYLLTMLRGPSAERITVTADRGEDYVPNIPLSEHAERHYLAMKNADTVTIDPHKAGLCQYPAGALCYRNGTMKGFITLEAPEVFHGEDDVNVGVYGLEGSKPGAAACGVLLSHQVIGLDQMGYGRILGQCQFGTKLFYCMWMTSAQPYDDFQCVNMIDIPSNVSVGMDVSDFIRTRILGRDNEDISQDEEAMSFLSKVGPDALINSFVVNPTGNTDVELCNVLQNKLFGDMNATVGQSPKRVPLFLTMSQLEPSKYGYAVEQLKERLGLTAGDEALGFLRQTCINPFQCSEAFVTTAGKLFRNTVLNCIASMDSLPGSDVAINHKFVVVSEVNEAGLVFLDYCPSWLQPASQYHVVVRMKVISNIEKFRSTQSSLNGVMFVTTRSKMIMHDLLRNYMDGNSDNNIIQFEGTESTGNKSSSVIGDLPIGMQVEDVFRYNRLESLKAGDHIEYPVSAQYFMYGDHENAYLSHVITKHKDYHQVVKLDELPHSVPYSILDIGTIITLPGVDGKPKYLDGVISDPLEYKSYTVDYAGKQNVPCKTTIKLGLPTAKIWFEQEELNKTAIPAHGHRHGSGHRGQGKHGGKGNTPSKNPYSKHRK